MIEVFNHAGFGVTDLKRSRAFYGKVLGFSMKVHRFEGDVKDLIVLEGDDVEAQEERLRAIVSETAIVRMALLLNPLDGALVEMAQPQPVDMEAVPRAHRWGDIGFLALGAKAYGLDDLAGVLAKKGATLESGVESVRTADGATWKSAFLRDPDGIHIELLETGEPGACRRPAVGGLSHLVIGVSDMDRSVDFYSRALGFDVVALDRDVTGPELSPSAEGGSVRTVVLKRSRVPGKTIPRGPGMVRLVQAKSFKGQRFAEGVFWGDLGILEFGFDVKDIDATHSMLLENGAEPFIPPARMKMPMGYAGGFAYVRDPDGNLLELIEMEKSWFVPARVLASAYSALVKVRSLF